MVNVHSTISCVLDVYVAQTSCMNCGGNDNPTYVWTLEPQSVDNTLQDLVWENFTWISDDGSLSLDVLAFLPVTEAENYALVLQGS